MPKFRQSSRSRWATTTASITTSIPAQALGRGGSPEATFPRCHWGPGAIPYNQGIFRTEWDYRGFFFGATVNYVGDCLNDGGFLANGANFQVNTDIASQAYFYSRRSSVDVTVDLQVSYAFRRPKSVDPVYAADAKGVRTQGAASSSAAGNVWQKMLWGTTIRAGVNHGFDKYPPYDPAAFNDNYDTSTYSLRNRFWYVGINKKF